MEHRERAHRTYEVVELVEIIEVEDEVRDEEEDVLVVEMRAAGSAVELVVAATEEDVFDVVAAGGVDVLVVGVCTGEVVVGATELVVVGSVDVVDVVVGEGLLVDVVVVVG